MAVNRRYYWLQLKEDFFKSKEMKLMRKLPGGDRRQMVSEEGQQCLEKTMTTILKVENQEIQIYGIGTDRVIAI